MCQGHADHPSRKKRGQSPRSRERLTQHFRGAADPRRLLLRAESTQRFFHQRFQSFKNGLWCPVGCLVASPAGQRLSSKPLELGPFLMAAGARYGIPTQHLLGRDSEARQQTNAEPSCLLNNLRNLPTWLHSVSSASWWPVIKQWLSLAQVSCHIPTLSLSFFPVLLVSGVPVSTPPPPGPCFPHTLRADRGSSALLLPTRTQCRRRHRVDCGVLVRSLSHPK